MRSDAGNEFRVPGGILSPGDLREFCLNALAAGHQYLELRQRQSVALAAEIPAPAPREGFLSHDRPNLVTAAAALKAGFPHPWVTVDTFREIINSFAFHPAAPVNIGIPGQTLVNPGGGRLNFIADDENGDWNISLRTGDKWIPLGLACKTYLIAPITAAILRRLRFTGPVPGWEDLLSRPGIRKSAPGVRGRYHRLPDLTGFHRSAETSWLGLAGRRGIFSLEFLEHLAFLCQQQTTPGIFITDWKTLIISDIREETAFDESLRRYNVPLFADAADLFWNVEPGWKQGEKLRRKFATRLFRDNSPAYRPGVSLVNRGETGDLPNQLVIRQTSRFPRRFSIFTAEQADPFAVNRRLAAENVNFRTALAFARTPPGNVNDIPPESAEEVIPALFRCTDCRSEYSAALGEPDLDIAAGTDFARLPESFRCRVCGAGKEKYSAVF